ncbi:MAG: PspA/IM30 family protein [Candidatus Riflebacteria bacterium]|nr:PspA/IM30 family protein [Candidatus Riflebacteria bacterium]
MFERLKRMIRSVVGWFIELGEDPEMILRQNVKDMQDQVPAMNQSIAMIKANQTLLQKEKDQLEEQIRSLTAKIKAALKTGRRDLALNFTTTLEQAKTDLTATEGQLKVATEAYEKAASVKSVFLRQIEAKSKEAMNAVQTKKRAEWQAKVADAMESFKVAGIDATHDEMVGRIQTEAAEKEARMHVALDNIDHQAIEVEKEAQSLEANETLRQIEMEMGLVSPEATTESTSQAEKTIGPRERTR